jgi:hypothetical protein
MAILSALWKSQFEVSLESTDGELNYPSSFITTTGFDIGIKENYSVFNPIEIATCYDHEYFEDLIGYVLDLSSSRVLDSPFKEKRFDLKVLTKNCTGSRNFGFSYCAHDCYLTGARFLDVDRCFYDDEDTKKTEGHETGGNRVAKLSLTLVPRYISRFIPEGDVGEDKEEELGKDSVSQLGEKLVLE